MRLSRQLFSKKDSTSNAPTLEAPQGFAPEDREGGAFNEEMFQHFLMIETKRSERSNRPFLLLLLDLKKGSDLDVSIEPTVATRLFSGLSQCLRETDFVGWYRKPHVVGAVLTQREGATGSETAHLVYERLRGALNLEAPSDPLQRLQVRAYRRPQGLRNLRS
jgi:hypothetical protein